MQYLHRNIFHLHTLPPDLSRVLQQRIDTFSPGGFTRPAFFHAYIIDMSSNVKNIWNAGSVMELVSVWTRLSFKMHIQVWWQDLLSSVEIGISFPTFMLKSVPARFRNSSSKFGIQFWWTYDASVCRTGFSFLLFLNLQSGAMINHSSQNINVGVEF